MNEPKQKIRIGFVGVGNMGQCAHLRNYASLPDCEVVAIAEVRARTAKRVAERYGIPRVYPSHREMLAAERLDGLVASQPFNRHGVLLPELIDSGLPIFIEKPLASTLEAGEAIVRKVQEKRSWIMVGYHKRSDPASEYARAEIEKLRATGELGRMTYVRILVAAGEWIAHGFWDLINEGDPRGTFEVEPPPRDMDQTGYGQWMAFINYYIHQVNLLRFFLGEPYRVTYAHPAGILLVGQSVSGLPCCIEMSPYRTSLDWQESALITFERGYVKVSLPAPMAVNRPGQVEIFKDPGNGATPHTLVPQLPWIHAMRRQAMNFLAAIRGERPPPCTAEEALEDLKVAREYLRLWKGI